MWRPLYVARRGNANRHEQRVPFQKFARLGMQRDIAFLKAANCAAEPFGPANNRRMLGGILSTTFGRNAEQQGNDDY